MFVNKQKFQQFCRLSPHEFTGRNSVHRSLLFLPPSWTSFKTLCSSWSDLRLNHQSFQLSSNFLNKTGDKDDQSPDGTVTRNRQSAPRSSLLPLTGYSGFVSSQSSPLCRKFTLAFHCLNDCQDATLNFKAFVVLFKHS